MLSCREVLARHSEYVDGVMAPVDAERWRAHLAACAMCARYDRVLRKGTSLLSKVPEIEPDPSFMLHLQYRLADEERRQALRPVTMNAATSVSIAAVLALAAWLPIVMIARGDEAATAIAPVSAQPAVTSTEIAWHGGDGMQTAPAHRRTAVRLSHTSPGVSLLEPHYTPLVIEPPTAPPSYTRVTLTSLEAR